MQNITLMHDKLHKIANQSIDGNKKKTYLHNMKKEIQELIEPLIKSSLSVSPSHNEV